MLALKRRRITVAVAAAAAVQSVMQIASDTAGTCEDVEREGALLLEIRERSAAIMQLIEADQNRGYGHGFSMQARLPTVQLPKSDAFDLYVQLPVEFNTQCGFTPAEFDVLLTAVMDVMLLCRDIDDEYGPELNALRRKRRFKYSARERLFYFLVYCRQYQSFRRTASSATIAWNTTSVRADFVWLRSQLVKMSWGTPDDREQQRLNLIRAGVHFVASMCLPGDC